MHTIEDFTRVNSSTVCCTDMCKYACTNMLQYIQIFVFFSYIFIKLRVLEDFIMLAVYHVVTDDFTRVKSSTCIFQCMCSMSCHNALSTRACMHVDEFTRAKSSNCKRLSQSIVHVHLCRRIYTCKIVYTLLYKQRRKSSPNDRLQFTVTCMHVDEFTRVILSTNDRRHNALYMYMYVDEFTRVKSSTNYCTNKSTVVCRRFYTCKIVWTILLA